MCSGCRNLIRDDILLLPAQDTIDDVSDELNDPAATRHPNPWWVLTRKDGIQKYDRYLQTRNISHQQYLNVIRNCALGHFANYNQRVVAEDDVAWLLIHDDIVNPPTICSLPKRKHTSSCHGGNYSLSECDAQAAW
jgi:hypothetical protein